MPTLKTIDLRSHRAPLREVPVGILNMPNLRTLDVTGHPIATPPLEVVQQGPRAIQSYWRQKIESGVDYLCEAKLLIVEKRAPARPRSARNFSDPCYHLCENESSTDGIEVREWTFPTAIRVNSHASPARP